MTEHPYTFDLALEVDVAEDEFLEGVADALIERGCDDATFSLRYGVPHAEFRRRGPDFTRALLSAVADLESHPDVRVRRIELDELLTASEIAERTGRSRQSVQQLIASTRGPGGFPHPADWVRGAKLWPWPKVAEWLRQARGAEVPASVEDEEFVRALNGLLETRLHLDRIGPAERRAIHAVLDWEQRHVMATESRGERAETPGAAALAALTNGD